MSVMPGFIQGFVHDSSNNAVAGATVQLLNSSDQPLSPPVSTTTSSTGYYAFNNVAPGTYDVMESAANYSTGVGASGIQTTINPASAIDGQTEIQVTVENLSSYSIAAAYTSDPYSYNGDTVHYELNATSYNPEGFDCYPASSGGDSAGAFVLTLSGNAGNVNPIVSDCTDLLDGIEDPPTAPFTYLVSLTPNTTSLTTNLEQFGYLYNTYGTTTTVPYPSGQGAGFGNTIDGAGLQIALWALEYNPDGSLNVNATNANDPFAINGAATHASIITAADVYLADASGKNEDVYFLNNPSPNVNSQIGQGMCTTDMMNFTNTPKGMPARPSAPRSPTWPRSAAVSTRPGRSPSTSTPTRPGRARRCTPTPMSRSPAARPLRPGTSPLPPAPITGWRRTTATATTHR
jgi:hypothetical protein